jgi:hypothetical protein
MRPLSYVYWNACSLRNKLAAVLTYLHPPPLSSSSPASTRFPAAHLAEETLEVQEPPLPDLLGFVECKLDPTDPDPDSSLDPIPDYSWITFPQAARSGGLAFLVRDTLSHHVRIDLSYNVLGATFSAPPRPGDATAAAATARNSAVVWLEVS